MTRVTRTPRLTELPELTRVDQPDFTELISIRVTIVTRTPRLTELPGLPELTRVTRIDHQSLPARLH